MIFSVPLRGQERKRVQIYSPSLPLEALHLVLPSSPPLTVASPPTSSFIDPLYIYLLCPGPLCDGRHEWRAPGVLGEFSPLAIFDQYYKNQPTDFLRKILPPCVPEYFIVVHTTAPSAGSFLPPCFRGDKEERKENVAGKARDSVLLHRAPFERNAIYEQRRILAVNVQCLCGRYSMLASPPEKTSNLPRTEASGETHCF